MRNFLISFLFIIVALVFSANTCSKDDPTEDPCDQYSRPLINRSFVITVEVQYKDSIPYQGNVDLSLFKKYCNDNISGEFHENGNANAEGYWFSGMQFIYKYENDYDLVDLTIKIINPTTSEQVVEHEQFFYGNVENLYYEVYKNYEITLPWDSGK